MGSQSVEESHHWSLLAITDCMQDAACLATPVDDVGSGGGISSRSSRTGLPENGGVGGERPLDGAALSAKRVSRLSSPCETTHRTGLQDGDRAACALSCDVLA
jgi:hypothetical protein